MVLLDTLFLTRELFLKMPMFLLSSVISTHWYIIQINTNMDIDTAQSTDGTVGSLTFEGKSFNACRTGDKDGAVDVYQIFAYAVSPDAQVNCTGIAIGTAIVNGSSAAFEYS